MAKFVWNGGVFKDSPLFAATTATQITVLDRADDSLASLWSDRDGTVVLGNPFNISDAGHIKFYADAGRYRITAANGGFSETWEDELLSDPNPSGEMVAGFIESPSDKDYLVVLKMGHGGTINETTTKSESGTCTATFKVNSVALGGTANSVSSTEQSQTHSSSNSFEAGDDLVLTISSNSSCSGMSFSISYTKGA